MKDYKKCNYLLWLIEEDQGILIRDMEDALDTMMELPGKYFLLLERKTNLLLRTFNKDEKGRLDWTVHYYRKKK